LHPNGRIQAEHEDGLRQDSFIEGRGVCQVREGKKKGWGLLEGHIYTTFNLEVGRHYIITWLLSPVGKGEEPSIQEGEQSVPDYP
jgi:hypothetical protein